MITRSSSAHILAAALSLCLLSAPRLCAQGGPPMITDDPGTPGNGKWEINLPIAFEHRPGEWALDAPGLDLNYGLGDHIQLTLQAALGLLKRGNRGLVAGLGGAEAALKWRFVDEDTSGFALSAFPRVLFNAVHSSVHRGLADPGTGFQIPVQFQKTFGAGGLGLEFGPLLSTIGRAQWLFGIIGGVSLGKTTELMVELHGTARTSFSRDTLTVNVGFRHELRKDCIWIASLGHDVHVPRADSLALIGYCGVQLLY